MAATAIMTGLESLVANLPCKVNEPLGNPPAAPSSPSGCSQREGEAEKLCRMVKWIQALLDDAEDRETREKSIKLWLDELRDVAYDAEDVLEEFEYELRRYQLMHQEKDPDSHQVCDPHFQQQIIAKIKGINIRFAEIYECKRALKLSQNDEVTQKKQNFVGRQPTSSLLGDSIVYGRDGDKAKVLDMLISSHGTKNVSVVSIHGMGGVGKTTLAQLVYNDERVKSYFEVRSWVCVSDRFDVLRLTKEILEAVTGIAMDVQVLNLLHEKLYDSLRGKRFLLVLDDLWNENLGQWEALWKPLSGGAAGSKVLITTRNEEVSRISRAIGTHHLKGLSKDDSWSLFAQCAFGCKNPHDHPDLASAGRKIVQKCGGLPLAIRTLGGLLFDEADEERWNEILTSDMWELPEEKNDILPALRLSYHYLPSPIKPCFAFCAVFPKDHVFKLTELVSFWMALGYVKPARGRCVEDIGQRYAEELRRRSFLQGDVPMETIKMHDLIHDLASSVWGPECSTIEAGKLFDGDGDGDASRKIRHVFFNCGEDVTTLSSCGATDRFRYLRAFYATSRWPTDESGVLSSTVVDDVLQRMKYLRVLHLLGMPISELPHSVGNLKHLRYLGVCGWRWSRLPETLGNLLYLQTLVVEDADTLKELPATLGNLLDLQTLIVRDAKALKEVPKSLKDLVNLRHLDLHLSLDLSMMPEGIGRLTQLRTLPEFVVGEGIHAAGIEELRHLNNLRGRLAIRVRSLSNWVNTEPHIIKHTKGLDGLCLKFYDLENTCEDESSLLLQEKLLESLRPHTNIAEVSISEYIGNRLPKWMEDPSYLGLKYIRLEQLKNCRSLPALGRLPSLVSLSVSSMPALASMGREFLGDGASVFPSLETLLCWDLPELEGLLSIGTEAGGAFPRLRYLLVSSCPKLVYVKLRHLTALSKLYVGGCDELTTLDYCLDSTSPSASSSSRLLPRSAGRRHIPRLQSTTLEDCPKLSLRPQPPVFFSGKFSEYGCPLLLSKVARNGSPPPAAIQR